MSEMNESQIKVIGAGFGRTGTTSLKGALEKLGFGPCYHMTEVFENPEHIPLWEAATRGESIEWEEIFTNYRATVDWPGAAFYERLVKAYPQAKVILTVRDPERWFESVHNTIYQADKVASSPVFSLLAFFVPQLKNMRRATPMVADLVWKQIFDRRFEDRQHAIEVFNDSIEEVKERVPEERLLVYEVSEGWEPLCNFLGVEVPENEPFPHLNDTESFRKFIRLGSILAIGVPVVLILVVGLALLLFARRRGRSRS